VRGTNAEPGFFTPQKKNLEDEKTQNSGTKPSFLVNFEENKEIKMKKEG